MTRIVIFRLSVALLACLSISAPAAAESCRDEIAALFKGGALDPFMRPARREVTMRVMPDGSETLVTDVEWEAVTRSISESGGTFYLVYGTTMWSGPSRDGPWMNTGSPLPEDFEEMTRQMADQNAANITEAQCPGTVDLDGRTVIQYSYRTRTDPNRHGSWFGGHYTAYIDPESGRLERLEIRDPVSSWAPDPAPHTDITTVTYDPTIQITRPE